MADSDLTLGEQMAATIDWIVAGQPDPRPDGVPEFTPAVRMAIDELDQAMREKAAQIGALHD